MEPKEEIRELFHRYAPGSMEKNIARIESQIGECISDKQYRTVWRPCLPFEDEFKPKGETGKEGEEKETRQSGSLRRHYR